MQKDFILPVLIFSSVLSLLALSACKPNTEQAGGETAPQTISHAPTTYRPVGLTETTELTMLAAGIEIKQFKTGKRHFDLYCTACHVAEVPRETPPNEANMLAPPAFAVANHYQINFKDLNERITAIKNFVVNPSEESAIMPGAVSRFGPMLKINLPEEQIHAISVYLATAEFKKPSWYRSHYMEQHGQLP